MLTQNLSKEDEEERRFCPLNKMVITLRGRPCQRLVTYRTRADEKAEPVLASAGSSVSRSRPTVLGAKCKGWIHLLYGTHKNTGRTDRSCPAATVAIHFATEGRVPKKQNRSMRLSFFPISRERKRCTSGAVIHLLQTKKPEELIWIVLRRLWPYTLRLKDECQRNRVDV